MSAASTTAGSNGDRAWQCVRGWFDPADKGYESRDVLLRDFRMCRIMPTALRAESLVNAYAPAVAAVYPKWTVERPLGVGAPAAS